MSKRNPVYTITITSEQIKLIRTYALRSEQLYIKHGLAELVQEDGDIKVVPFFRCYFCGKGAYDQASFIPHTSKCIIPLAEKEYFSLNEQFMQVESTGEA